MTNEQHTTGEEKYEEVKGWFEVEHDHGDYFTAYCTGHPNTNTPALSGKKHADGVGLKCHAGCSTEQILEPIGKKPKDLFVRNRKVTSLSVVREERAKEGCTLEGYAEKTALPVEFLESLGLEEAKYRGKPFVKIPYPDEEGKETATRYRHALEQPEEGTDRRFKWKAGSKAMLYGLEQMPRIRKAKRSWVVLVEGESDQQTVRYSGFPTFGIPGASTWKPEWAEHLEGVERVYFLKEADKAGDNLLQALIQDEALKDKLYVLNMAETGFKDANEWYVSDPENFKVSFLNALKNDAKHYPEIEQEQREEAASSLWEECKTLASEADILEIFSEDLKRSGVAGEKNVVETLYLVVTTRYLERPSSAAIKGPSSGGKSYLTEKVLKYHPEEAHYSLTAMSEKALAYSEEPMEHRFLVIYEATGMEGDMQSYLIRSLLSEGHIRYELAEPTPEGVRSRLIEKPGPTGLLVTTTQVKLHAENETRLLSLTVNDSQLQTKNVMHSMAQRYRRRKGALITPSLKRWHALQRWIAQAGVKDVNVPYAEVVSGLIPPIAVRLRRDFELILNLLIFVQVAKLRGNALT